jgi:hypothetical protein
VNVLTPTTAAENNSRLNEDSYARGIALLLGESFEGCKVDVKLNLLYSLSFDDLGQLKHGVDNDSGYVKRGGGTGFEQDLVLFEEPNPNRAAVSVIPRVVVEFKLRKGVNTHGILVYSEKARRIKAIYPYLRYGLLIGNADSIPPRVLRLAESLDFITTLPASLSPSAVEDLKKNLAAEVEASRAIAKLQNGTRKIRGQWRRLDLYS